MTREFVACLLVMLFGALGGAAVGCGAELIMVSALGRDSMPMFWCFVGGGVCAALLAYCAPVVAAYARNAVGRG